MEELNPEIKRLHSAVGLLRRNNAGDIEDAVGIIEDVISELAGHDCDDLASECTECEGRRNIGQDDVPYVRECLELGLPALVEKYGYDSNEVRAAQGMIQQQS